MSTLGQVRVVTSTTTEDTTRDPSGAIWGTCPRALISGDFANGWYVDEDFMQCGGQIGNTGDLIGSAGGFVTYADIGVTFAAELAEKGGGLLLSGNDADNDEGHLGSSGGFIISDTGTDAHSLWFEARIKVEAVTNNGISTFVGLASTDAIAANGMVDDTGVLLTTGSFLGFRTLAADGDALQFIYQAASQTIDIQIAALDVLAADTWVKVGFMFKPRGDTGTRITIFLNGVQQTTFVTGTEIAAATFPDGEYMGAAWMNKVGTAAEVTSHLGWLRCYQSATE